MNEHREGLVPGFTATYQVDTLVYLEETSDITAAISREKQLKNWRRSKKVALLRSMNPHWHDLQRDPSADARDDRVEVRDDKEDYCT